MESGPLATALCVLVLPGAAFSAEPAPQRPSIAVPQAPSPLVKPSPVPRVVAPLKARAWPSPKGISEGSPLVQFNAGTRMNPINGSDWACWLWLYDATTGTGKWVEADHLMATSYNRTKPYKTGDQGYLR
jgi:hypothetical protein